MISLGIDLSSQFKNTAAVLITWRGGRARAEIPCLSCTDDDLYPLIAQADVVGIDAPFGWPVEFVNAVNNWPHETWSREARDRLRFRETDRFVHQQQNVWPLSVSTDIISLPAMRAMSLLRRHGVADRSGDGRFFEVYPAASLRAWGMNSRGYKETKSITSTSLRRKMINALHDALPALDFSDSAFIANPDAFDALIASLTARCAATGYTLGPSDTQRPLAQREGWIHLPTELPPMKKSRDPRSQK
ncbi:MAG TPA: DUF429 domain-containing protein [Opitutaceae bacterium]|nr:DUF429 domain-containing protein [Opitutaceae bacterium]